MKTDMQPPIHLILKITANYYKCAQKKKKDCPLKKTIEDWGLFLPWNILLAQMILNFAWAILDVNEEIK